MRRCLVALLLLGFALPMLGCVKEKDKDDDLNIKVDNEGETKSIKVDKD